MCVCYYVCILGQTKEKNGSIHYVLWVEQKNLVNWPNTFELMRFPYPFAPRKRIDILLPLIRHYIHLYARLRNQFCNYDKTVLENGYRWIKFSCLSIWTNSEICQQQEKNRSYSFFGRTFQSDFRRMKNRKNPFQRL